MQIEKIEQAIDLITFNAQTIQNELSTDFFDALIENNVYYKAYLEGEKFELTNQEVINNFNIIQSLELTSEELRKVFQLVLVKGYQTTPIQANHSLTPDSIGFILAYLINTLVKKDKINLIDFGSGTANLTQTIEFGLPPKKLGNLTGIEVDELLIDLSASIADLTESRINLIAMDAVQFKTVDADVIISDLPIGFYPKDEIAAHFQVYSDKEHTYSHHLLIENAMNNLNEGGFGIFIAPLTLFDSAQSDLFAKWLKKSAYLQMVVNLPDSLFKGKQVQKVIYVFEKPSESNEQKPTFVYHLTDLKAPEVLKEFMTKINYWLTD